MAGYRESAPALMMAASARARCRNLRCASRFCSRRRSSCSCRSSCCCFSSAASASASAAAADGMSERSSAAAGERQGVSFKVPGGAGEQRREVCWDGAEEGGTDVSWLLRVVLLMLSALLDVLTSDGPSAISMCQCNIRSPKCP
jgi:hypothetical protein